MVRNEKSKMIVLKCPSNYNIAQYYEKFQNIYVQKIKNYMIIYIWI